MQIIKIRGRMKSCGSGMKRASQQLIYDLYEIYHVERLENAFVDIDEILAEREAGSSNL